MISSNFSYLSNVVLSGYSQMNQMKYMLAMNGSRNTSSASSVKSVTKTSALSDEDTAFIKSYQEKMTQLKDAAEAVLNPKTNKLSAVSGDSAVAAAAGSLQNSSDVYQVDVQQTASAQVNRSREFNSTGELPSAGGGLTIRSEKGVFNLNLSSAGAKTNKEALEKFAQKINSVNAGVTANVVTKDGKSSLEISGATGSEHAFTLSGSFAESMGLEDAAVESRDAVFSVTKNGTETESFTFSTNEVEIDGFSITLKGEGSTEIKASNGEKTGVSTDAVSKLIDSYNSALKFLNDNSSKGVGVLRQMRNMLMTPVSERSMKLIGISVASDGTMSLDKAAFEKALRETPSLTKELTDTIASGFRKDAEQGMNIQSGSLLSATSNSRASSGKSSQTAISQSQLDTFQLMSMYNRTGVYNMSNYYAVGALMSQFA